MPNEPTTKESIRQQILDIKDAINGIDYDFLSGLDIEKVRDQCDHLVSISIELKIKLFLLVAAERKKGR